MRERTTKAAHFPLETATLTRLRESKNSIPRGTSSADDAVIDTITTGASWPWNLSTVPTLIPESPALSSSRRSSATCALYGATTRTSSAVMARAAPCAGSCQVSASTCARNLHNLSGLLGGLDRVPFVVDVHDMNTGDRGGEAPFGCLWLFRAEPTFVGVRRHAVTERGVHAPRMLEEVATLGRQRGMAVVEPSECGAIDWLGMDSLAHLGELLRVAEEEEPLSTGGDGQGIGESKLPRFVDDEQVELPGI